jgi:hypothetical protein
MTSNEIYETLTRKGFETSFSADHNTVTASLNRTISTMEVWMALDLNIEQSQIRRISDNTVAISE